MLFMVFGGIVGGIATLFVTKELINKILLTIPGIILGVIAGLITYALIGGLIGIMVPRKEVIAEEQKIYALNDSSSITYIYRGYMNEKLVYRYVIETDKGKHVEKVAADNCYIKEGDYSPKIVKHNSVFANAWFYMIAYDLKEDSSYYYEFYVPKNTVTEQYKIDLE